MGPVIGGALARPCVVYPSLFPQGTIWDRFPYLLPNLFSAICVLLGVTIGILFLEETHAEKKKQRDPGLELGDYLISRLAWNPFKTRAAPPSKGEEEPLLVDVDEQLPGYQTRENSPPPHLTSMPAPDPHETLDLDSSAAVSQGRMEPESRPEPRTFTRPVLFNIVSYGILAL